MGSLRELIDLAQREIGYLEKASNSNLDNKIANAGKNNYTKYARDLDDISGFYNGKKNGYAWCDVFVDWLFVQIYGAQKAKELLCQPDNSYGAGVSSSMNYYKNKGQFYTSNPKIGDQIFFKSGSLIVHTGIVYAVDSSKVYTIEGNTSSENKVVANGGSVCAKSYSLKSNYIAGYGRPNYGETIIEDEKVIFIKKVQSAIGAKVDGIVGKETLGKAPLLSKKTNSKHKVVKIVQERLISLGYAMPRWGADGVFGNEMEKAVKQYQLNSGLTPDGIIGQNTWKKLLV